MAMPANTKETIAAILTEAFAPQQLEVVDDSDRHRNHSGARQSGGGHFIVYIVSDQFGGLSQIQRHQKVYQVLGTLMSSAIHALSITAETPTESERI